MKTDSYGDAEKRILNIVFIPVCAVGERYCMECMLWYHWTGTWWNYSSIICWYSRLWHVQFAVVPCGSSECTVRSFCFYQSQISHDPMLFCISDNKAVQNKVTAVMAVGGLTRTYDLRKTRSLSETRQATRQCCSRSTFFCFFTLIVWYVQNENAPPAPSITVRTACHKVQGEGGEKNGWLRV